MIKFVVRTESGRFMAETDSYGHSIFLARHRAMLGFAVIVWAGEHIVYRAG